MVARNVAAVQYSSFEYQDPFTGSYHSLLPVTTLFFLSTALSLSLSLSLSFSLFLYIFGADHETMLRIKELEIWKELRGRVSRSKEILNLRTIGQDRFLLAR